MGIITRNNRRFISFTNRYNKIIDFDFIREFGFAIDSDFVKNFNDELNLISLNFKGNISITGNTSIDYNYDLDAFKNFLGYDFKNIGIHELEIRSSPTELINFSGSLSWGKDLSYNESIPEVGNLFSSLFKIRLQLNNNFSITPSIRTSSLKKPEDGSDFFSGSIIRLRSTYQFNNFLNIPMFPLSLSISTLISLSDPNFDFAAFAIPVSIELIISSLSIDFSKATASAILSNSSLSALLFNIFLFAPKKNGLKPIL